MPHEDFNVDELATYLHLTPPQVIKLASREKLPGRRIGGQWKFSKAEIHHWLEEKIGVSDVDELKKVEGMLETDSEKHGELKLKVTDWLRPELIFELKAKTRQRVITQICEQCTDLGVLWDPQKMGDAIRQREQLHPTAIDCGVALLHPRRPIPSISGEPFLALGRTFQGIPFGGPRGQLTDLFFLISSHDDRGHLNLLAKLSRLISEEDFVTTIRHEEIGAIHDLFVEAEEKLWN